MGLLNKILGKALDTVATKTADSIAKKAADSIAKKAGDAVSTVIDSAFGDTGAKAAEETSEDTVISAETRDKLEKIAADLEKKTAELEKAEAEWVKAETKAAMEGNVNADYFAAIISENIPGVTCEKNVSLASLGAEVPAKSVDVDVVLSVGGAPKAALLIVPKNKYKNACYVNTMASLEAKGIKAVRFMQEFSNDPAYVVSRMKGLL